MLGLSFYDSNGIHLSSKEFIWLDNLPVAQIDTSFNSSGAIEFSHITWLHTDHLNTPLFATNAAGNVVWRWDRDAFGTIEPDTDPDGDGVFVDIPLRFPGQIKMPGDGNLYYNWHRFYDPATGRYISADPIGLDGGINLYAYVSNDPVNSIDPWGLEGNWAYGYNSFGLPNHPSTSVMYDTLSKEDKCKATQEWLSEPPSDEFFEMFMGIGSARYKNIENMFHGKKIRKLQKLTEKWGGRGKDWKKVKGIDTRTGKEMHWYQKKGDGTKYGLKKKGDSDPF